MQFSKFRESQFLFSRFPTCLVRISFRFSGIRHLVRAMAAVTDADRRSYIAQHVSADLQYVWQDNEIFRFRISILLAQHYKSFESLQHIL